MEKLWFFAQGSSSEKQGPVTETQMRSLIAEGKLQPTDLVWSEGMSNTIIVGIPMIMGGVALLAAKDLLPQLSSNDPALGAFLLKLKTFFVTTGFVYILSLVIGLILVLIFVFGAAAGTFNALKGL